MPNFSAGEPHVQEYVSSAINDFHPDLMEAQIRVICAVPLRGGKPVKIAKAGPSDSADGYDFILMYDGTAFEAMRQEMAMAFMDHALSGLKGEQHKGRNGQIRWVYKKVSPIEFYPDVLSRHEAVVPEWREVAEQFKQLNLDFDVTDKAKVFNLR